ncbi:cupin domain-containing protein [Streptomyces sp. NPDC050161]|uniref:cupin domain-containing protein n=1 Tax=Streptomyces sp. NPDC050161 TaxID=3365604 RepID=UPI00379BBD5A
MHIHSWDADDLTFEPDYNTKAQRLVRFDGADEPYEGGAWVIVPPRTTMTEHINPDGESELFYVVSGTGDMEVAGERQRVKFGDTVFIPPHEKHLLVNDGDTPLVFLSLWWGGQPSDGAAATQH